MNYYNNFIFDLDGTLLNTIGDLTNALNHSLKQYGYPERTLEEVNSFVGNGISKLIERSLLDGKENKDFRNILNEFSKFYTSHLTDYTTPYKDILLMLNSLKENGCKIAIVSNKADNFVKELSNHFFKDYINISIGETKEIKRKPNKDMVEYAIKYLNASPETTVYVGDSDVDIITAKNSSLPCISVSWGFRTKKFLIENGAQIIIDNPIELLKYVKK